MWSFFVCMPVAQHLKWTLEKKCFCFTKGAFHFAKISGPIGWNANGVFSSNGNFSEQIYNLLGYFIFSVLTGWNGNYRFISTACKSVCAYTSFLCCSSTICQWDCKFFTHMVKAFLFDTENFQNFKTKIFAKWKAPQPFSWTLVVSGSGLFLWLLWIPETLLGNKIK